MSDENKEPKIQADTENIYTDDAVDPIYQAKARILNDAFRRSGWANIRCVSTNIAYKYTNSGSVSTYEFSLSDDGKPRKWGTVAGW